MVIKLKKRLICVCPLRPFYTNTPKNTGEKPLVGTGLTYLANVGSLFLVPIRFTDLTLYSLSTLNLLRSKPRPVRPKAYLLFRSLDRSRFSVLRLYRVKSVNLMRILCRAGVNNECRLFPWQY